MHDLIYVIVHGEEAGSDDETETLVAYTWTRREADEYVESTRPWSASEWYFIEAVPHLAHLPKET